MVTMAPTGKIITGHVLDVRKEPIEQALKAYDKQLYLKWNPKKLKGWGCWEIRRRPQYKTIVDLLPYNDGTIVQLEYQEMDIIHHVMDVAYLNYDAITKLKAMDTWAYGTEAWKRDLESSREEYEQKARERSKAELGALARDIKPIIRDMKEKILSGWNPAEIASLWDKL